MPLSLLHPGLFALGIAAVSIPIVLHLFKGKRRPIEWGAMRFLEQAYRKRRRILTIEQLILLMLRCTLLVLIAAGVGSLMLGSGSGKSVPTTMVIVLDDSIGSALIDGQSSILELNKSFALRAIDELDAQRGDQVMLIGAAMPARGMVLPQSSDIEAVRSIIQRLESTDSQLDLARAIELAGKVTREPKQTANTVLVFALAARSFDLSASPPAASLAFDRVILPTLPTNTIENIGIASASPTRSLITHSKITLPVGVRVELLRSGIGAPEQPDDSAEPSSTIRIYDRLGTLIGQRTLRWGDAQTTLSAAIAIDPQAIETLGAQTALVRIEIDDDANLRDNTHLVPLATRKTVRVGVVDRVRESSGQVAPSTISASRWVRAALAPDERFGISIVDIDPARASAMGALNLDALIVLCPSMLDEPGWDRIAQLNESGMLVVFAPDAQGASLRWLDRVETIAPRMLAPGSVLREHQRPIMLDPDQTIPASSLFAGIESEFGRLARAIAAGRSVRLVPGDKGLAMGLFDDGSALAVQSQPTHRQGLVVVLGVGFDLEWSNLIARPMVVPMMQEIVRQGVGRSSAMPTIRAGQAMPSPAWAIANQQLELETRSRTSAPSDDTTRAGLIAQLDAQGVTRSLVIINPDAEHARTDPGSPEALERALLDRIDVASIDWVEHAESLDDSDPQRTRMSILDSVSPGVSIGLWMFLIAAIIATIECVLAWIFTARLFETQGARQ